MATKKSTATKTLFRMTEKGATADKKGKLYEGHVGGFALGAVVAPNKTAARKKLLGIARKLLK